MKINTALILCAGFGKRLNPLTLDTPKPLIELNNVSVLETCINLIESLDIKEIFINTFYLKDQIHNFVNKKNFKPKNNLSKKFETLPGVAQVALQMGKHVSKQIQNDLNNVERKTFNYKDLGEMATIGKSKAVVDILNLRFGGVIAWLIWLFVHLIAITNFKNKLMIFTQWFWGYLTSQRHSRIIR